MRAVGWTLVLGGAALACYWPSDAIAFACIFVVAAGFVFVEVGSAKPDPWDDLGRGRIGL